MSGGFDYSEFKAFRKNWAHLTKDFENWLYSFLFNQGMLFIRNVKLRTPVDTGDLINHWELDPNIVRIGDILHIYFTNVMYYATFVEYGHAKPYKSGAGPGSVDWVDGFFMMTVAIEDIEMAMPAKFDLAFKKYLDGLGLA